MCRLLLLAVVCCIAASGCRPASDSQPAKLPETTGETAETATELSVQTPMDPASFPLFVSAEQELGVDFQYETGGIGQAWMFETFGGGAGWLDFDNDGFADLYLVQGGDPYAPPGQQTQRYGNQLYRNLDGQRFVAVGQASGSADEKYGQGLAAGDYDNDGFDDLYITNIRDNALLRNQGDGTFVDVTQQAGVGDARWSTSAAWSDLDGDGDLDLYVCNYVQYGIETKDQCTDDEGRPKICAPNDFPALDNSCYENLGNGTFREVSAAWQVVGTDGKSLGVAIADVNLDTLPDIYVANDITPNHLFMGQVNPAQSGVSFAEQAVELGCALSEDGKMQASMGIACADYDANGYPDFYVTHFDDDSNTLYSNLGAGFRDVTRREGLHKPTLAYLGFGTVMEDFDADGAMDVYVANGHVDLTSEGEPRPMTPQVFSYDPAARSWLEQTQRAGEMMNIATVGRGVAAGDFDNDGDVDLAVCNQESPAMVLRNESVRGNWVSLELIGTVSNRRAIGARVVLRCGDTQLSNQLIGGGSYCAASQLRLFFGLGELHGDCSATIYWPHRPNTPQLVNLPVNEHSVIREQE